MFWRIVKCSSISRRQHSATRLANRRPQRRLYHRQPAFCWQKFSDARAEVWHSKNFCGHFRIRQPWLRGVLVQKSRWLHSRHENCLRLCRYQFYSSRYCRPAAVDFSSAVSSSITSMLTYSTRPTSLFCREPILCATTWVSGYYHAYNDSTTFARSYCQFSTAHHFQSLSYVSQCDMRFEVVVGRCKAGTVILHDNFTAGICLTSSNRNA